jgi:hypothetical protein
MSVNWLNVLRELRSYPPSTHNFRPPCTQDRIEALEQQLGRLPADVSAMLRHFNGARLFDIGAGGELATLFGLSERPPLPPLEWAVDWYIDKFTPMWRAGGNHREDQWAVAMMSYGELILIEGQGTVRKWDTSGQGWSPGMLSLADWIDELLREGAAYVKEG